MSRADRLYRSILEKGSEEDGDSMVRLCIPLDSARKVYGFKNTFIDSNVLKDLIDEYNDSVEPDSLASIATVWKSWKAKIHPVVDLDSKDKNCQRSDDIIEQIGNDMVGVLKRRFPQINRWNFTTRKGDGRGIHVFPLGVCMDNKSFVRFRKICKSVIENVFHDWTVDFAANVTLPGCVSKGGGSDYVYKSLDTETLDPFPGCVCNCMEIDDFVEDFASSSVPQQVVERNPNAETEFFLDLKRAAQGMPCVPENAILFAIVSPNSEDPLYKSAKALNDVLKVKSSRDACDALLVEYFLSESAPSFELHQDRSVDISKAFIQCLEKLKEMQLDETTLMKLISYQIPFVSASDDKIYLYTRRGWVLETMSYLKVWFAVLKDRVIGNDFKLKCSQVLQFVRVFWHLEEKVHLSKNFSNENFNEVVATRDHYLFSSKCDVFLKSTVLYPQFMNMNLLYTRADIESELEKFRNDKFSRIEFIINSCDRILDGELSVAELFGDNFLSDPCILGTYFIVSFMMFKSKQVRHFIHILRRMMFGMNKKIVFCVGHCGDNGKSTFLKVLMNCFGNTAGILSDKEARNISSNQTSPDLIKNSNKKVTLLDESGEMKINENFLKRLTGDNPCSSRMLFCDTEVFVCRTNFLCTGNSKPVISIDSALRKRLYSYSTNTEFVESLKEDFFHQRTDMTDWKRPRMPKLDIDTASCGFGLLLLLLGTDPDISDVDVTKFSEEPTIDIFIRNHICESEGSTLPDVEVYREIQTFCSSHNFDPSTLMNEFRQVYRERFINSKYRDLCLKNSMINSM